MFLIFKISNPNNYFKSLKMNVKKISRMAGIILVILPTVIYGGVSILTLLLNDPAYMQNPLRQNLWRAGHAHAGVLLILSLVVLRYVDEANLSEGLKRVVRQCTPLAAILLPAAYFLSVLDPRATRPNDLIYLGLCERSSSRCRAIDIRHRIIKKIHREQYPMTTPVTSYLHRLILYQPPLGFLQNVLVKMCPVLAISTGSDAAATLYLFEPL